MSSFTLALIIVCDASWKIVYMFGLWGKTLVYRSSRGSLSFDGVQFYFKFTF